LCAEAFGGVGQFEMRAEKGQNILGKRLLREFNGAKATLHPPETY
jgi:glutamine amidotransferase-like uncharacterized protein